MIGRPITRFTTSLDMKVAASSSFGYIAEENKIPLIEAKVIREAIITERTYANLRWCLIGRSGTIFSFNIQPPSLMMVSG
jgi:hypothetical protein